MAYRRTELPPFSKIAFGNLGNDKRIVERLNREMEMWVRSKKGVDDLIRRIREVTGMSLKQAKRVARTERTRVQGQARYEAIQGANLSRASGEAALKKQWVARNDAFTRGSHLPMSGQVQKATEYFISGAGNKLMYPGDPRAPVEEIISCRCYMRSFKEVTAV